MPNLHCAKNLITSEMLAMDLVKFYGGFIPMKPIDPNAHLGAVAE